MAHLIENYITPDCLLNIGAWIPPPPEEMGIWPDQILDPAGTSAEDLSSQAAPACKALEPLPATVPPSMLLAPPPFMGPPPFHRRKIRLSQAPPPLYVGVPEMFAAAPPVQSMYMTSQDIERMMSSIPFASLTREMPRNKALAVERFVKDKLPMVLQGMSKEETKAVHTSKSRVLGECRIRCDGRYSDKGFEVYIRYGVMRGGVKKISQKMYLIGPQQGRICAYAKPFQDGGVRRNKENDKMYCMRSQELVQEVCIGQLFRNSSHIIPIEMVPRRKRPTQIKAIQMPWCNGGDLAMCLKMNSPPLSHHDRLQIIREIALGIREIHSKNMCHMDLKPGNVLIQRTAEGISAFICDLGRVCFKDVRMPTPISTRGYTAPEQIVKDAETKFSMDIWNIGLIALEILHGQESNLYVSEEVVLQDKDFNHPPCFPTLVALWYGIHTKIMRKLGNSPCDQLIKRMISFAPQERPTADEVMTAVEKLLIVDLFK